MFIYTIFRIFIGRLNEDETKFNWIYKFNFVDYSDIDIYATSCYFTVATVVTVGYGDITPTNLGERFFVIFLMLIGVVSFSFSTGAIASIISSYDSSQAKLKEKM